MTSNRLWSSFYGRFGSKWGRSFSTRNHGSSVQVFACALQFCEGRMYVRGFLFGTKAMSWAQEPQTVTGQCQRHLKQNAIWGIGLGQCQNAHLLRFAFQRPGPLGTIRVGAV